jgi:hypothetical protein
MSHDVTESKSPLGTDFYELIRTDTERVINELLAVMRNRRETAVDEHLRNRSFGTKTGNETAVSAVDSARLNEIRTSHSTGFALALLQGAVEAFENERAGLELLKRLIEAEIVEMEQVTRFANKATSAGSPTIN